MLPNGAGRHAIERKCYRGYEKSKAQGGGGGWGSKQGETGRAGCSSGQISIFGALLPYCLNILALSLSGWHDVTVARGSYIWVAEPS